MNPEPTRAEQLFASALAIADRAERAAFIRRACAGNTALRVEVESLLAAHKEAGGFMRAVALAETLPMLPTEKSGERIGRYRLLELIGTGGFGDVWMAEQEQPVRRRVALKIIKLGMDTREVVARFEAERQALAMMDHPSIARVFDGGATEAGRPYFVMELVKGASITRYCDELRLTNRERIELFIDVCHAVQHAHQKGIIHRDLKPSNILVMELDGKAVPKVIDFGVAKATEQRLTEKTLFTRLGQMLGTPAYMSPEQAGLGGLDIDTRTDIYSLGVILYELLIGQPPFDTRKLLEAGYEAILRTIREVEPPKPSTRLSSLGKQDLEQTAHQRRIEVAKLNRMIRGDLDWIVVKALEKDRNRRYVTAQGFANDLLRYLKDEPVEASPPALAYRFGKTIRRHRLAMAFSAALAASLIGGTAVSLWQAWQATRYARAAETQRRVATNETARAESAHAATREAMVQLSDTLSQIRLQRVEQLLQPTNAPPQADPAQALAQLARALRENPQDFRSTYRLLALLSGRNFPRPVSERTFSGRVLDLAFNGNGLLVAVKDRADGRVTVWNYDSGTRQYGPLGDGGAIILNFVPAWKEWWLTRFIAEEKPLELSLRESAAGSIPGDRSSSLATWQPVDCRPPTRSLW
jgi:serine/threonine protein kinase